MIASRSGGLLHITRNHRYYRRGAHGRPAATYCTSRQSSCGCRTISDVPGNQVVGLATNRFVQKRPTRILSDQGRRGGNGRLSSMPSPHSTSPIKAGLVGSERVRRCPHRRPRSAPRAASPAVPALSGPGPHLESRPHGADWHRATAPAASLTVPVATTFSSVGLADLQGSLNRSSARTISKQRCGSESGNGHHSGQKGTAIRAIFAGKNRQYNRRFLQMCIHYLVEPVTCSSFCLAGAVAACFRRTADCWRSQGASFAKFDDKR